MTDAVMTREQAAAHHCEILQRVVELMGYEATVEVLPSDESDIYIHISTEDPGRLIGRNAAGLEALQLLLSRMLLHKETGFRCLVDIERYRERRKDKLREMAFSAEDRALATGDAVQLPAMNAWERRVVHRALESHEEVTTESGASEEDGRKRVAVRPAAEANQTENED